MGIFESFKEIDGQIVNDGWVQILDDKSNWTIEDFPYDKGVDETITKPHCWKCVTVNQCWFKNEDNKMPKEYDYGTANVFKLAKGLYHPNCHCEKSFSITPSESNIDLIVPNGKEMFTILKKAEWIKSMGFSNTEEFFKVFYKQSIKSYLLSDYVIKDHTIFGVKITLFINLENQNNKMKKYKIKASYTVFPNGKLKLNTHLGGWA